MKTHFSAEQLQDPRIGEAERILGTCQHFGFCTSGCPTYVLLHDENDGPRGRIDLIKDMLESGGAPDPRTVEHIDRCLSCMSCMTTCAVKVDYLHLVDTAREYIEEHHRRPLAQRWTRALLARVLPSPALFRPALGLGRLAARMRGLAPAALRPMLELIPPVVDAPVLPNATCFPAQGERRWRVALLAGCVQPVLAPHINAATIRLLTRLGCEVHVPPAAGCCGSLPLHLGKAEAARRLAAANVRAWQELLQREPLDAILVNASGCGSTVKDYGHLLSGNAALSGLATKVAGLARDVCEWLATLELPAPSTPRRHRVAYHDACSLRNVQKVTVQPRRLLRQAGFDVADVPEGHFCCGSAGTYNLLQPELARDLGKRKALNIAATSPQITAAGNIGCITQIGLYAEVPVVHTIELLDWAWGGPLPVGLRDRELTELPLQPVSPPSQPLSASGQPVTFYPPARDADDIGVW